MKNKVIALIASIALLITMTLPGTLAISSDEEILGSGATADMEMQEQETEDVQQPDEEQEAQEPPAAEEEPTVNEENPTTCTCDPAPAAGEAHREGCPLYAKAEEQVPEISPKASLSERLLAAQDLDTFLAIANAANEEERNSLASEEFDAIDAYYIYLSTGEYPNEEPAANEALEIVTFTNVAPLVGSDN